jgi:hypothetical protein
MPVSLQDETSIWFYFTLSSHAETHVPADLSHLLEPSEEPCFRVWPSGTLKTLPENFLPSYFKKKPPIFFFVKKTSSQDSGGLPSAFT